MLLFSFPVSRHLLSFLSLVFANFAPFLPCCFFHLSSPFPDVSPASVFVLSIMGTCRV